MLSARFLHLICVLSALAAASQRRRCAKPWARRRHRRRCIGGRRRRGADGLLDQGVDFVKSKATSIGNRVKALAKKVVDGVKSIVALAKMGAEWAAPFVVKAALDLYNDPLGTLKSWAATAYSYAAIAASAALAYAKKGLEFLASLLPRCPVTFDLMKAWVDVCIFDANFPPLNGMLENAFQSIISAIVSGFASLVQILVKALRDVLLLFDWVMAEIMKGVQIVLKAMMKGLEAMKNLLESILDKIKNAWQQLNFWSAVASVFEALANPPESNLFDFETCWNMSDFPAVTDCGVVDYLKKMLHLPGNLFGLLKWMMKLVTLFQAVALMLALCFVPQLSINALATLIGCFPFVEIMNDEMCLEEFVMDPFTLWAFGQVMNLFQKKIKPIMNQGLTKLSTVFGVSANFKLVSASRSNRNGEYYHSTFISIQRGLEKATPTVKAGHFKPETIAKGRTKVNEWLKKPKKHDVDGTGPLTGYGGLILELILQCDWFINLQGGINFGLHEGTSWAFVNVRIAIGFYTNLQISTCFGEPPKPPAHLCFFTESSREYTATQGEHQPPWRIAVVHTRTCHMCPEQRREGQCTKYKECPVGGRLRWAADFNFFNWMAWYFVTALAGHVHIILASKTKFKTLIVLFPFDLYTQKVMEQPAVLIQLGFYFWKPAAVPTPSPDADPAEVAEDKAAKHAAAATQEAAEKRAQEEAADKAAREREAQQRRDKEKAERKRVQESVEKHKEEEKNNEQELKTKQDEAEERRREASEDQRTATEDKQKAKQQAEKDAAEAKRKDAEARRKKAAQDKKDAQDRYKKKQKELAKAKKEAEAERKRKQKQKKKNEKKRKKRGGQKKRKKKGQSRRRTSKTRRRKKKRGGRGAREKRATREYNKQNCGLRGQQPKRVGPGRKVRYECKTSSVAYSATRVLRLGSNEGACKAPTQAQDQTCQPQPGVQRIGLEILWWLLAVSFAIADIRGFGGDGIGFSSTDPDDGWTGDGNMVDGEPPQADTPQDLKDTSNESGVLANGKGNFGDAAIGKSEEVPLANAVMDKMCADGKRLDIFKEYVLDSDDPAPGVVKYGETVDLGLLWIDSEWKGPFFILSYAGPDVKPPREVLGSHAVHIALAENPTEYLGMRHHYAGGFATGQGGNIFYLRHEFGESDSLEITHTATRKEAKVSGDYKETKLGASIKYGDSVAIQSPLGVDSSTDIANHCGWLGCRVYRSGKSFGHGPKEDPEELTYISIEKGPSPHGTLKYGEPVNLGLLWIDSEWKGPFFILSYAGPDVKPPREVLGSHAVHIALAENPTEYLGMRHRYTGGFATGQGEKIFFLRHEVGDVGDCNVHARKPCEEEYRKKLGKSIKYGDAINIAWLPKHEWTPGIYPNPNCGWFGCRVYRPGNAFGHGQKIWQKDFKKFKYTIVGGWKPSPTCHKDFGKPVDNGQTACPSDYPSCVEGKCVSKMDKTASYCCPKGGCAKMGDTSWDWCTNPSQTSCKIPGEDVGYCYFGSGSGAPGSVCMAAPTGELEQVWLQDCYKNEAWSDPTSECQEAPRLDVTYMHSLELPQGAAIFVKWDVELDGRLFLNGDKEIPRYNKIIKYGYVTNLEQGNLEGVVENVHENPEKKTDLRYIMYPKSKRRGTRLEYGVKMIGWTRNLKLKFERRTLYMKASDNNMENFFDGYSKKQRYDTGTSSPGVWLWLNQDSGLAIAKNKPQGGKKEFMIVPGGSSAKAQGSEVHLFDKFSIFTVDGNFWLTYTQDDEWPVLSKDATRPGTQANFHFAPWNAIRKATGYPRARYASVWHYKQLTAGEHLFTLTSLEYRAGSSLRTGKWQFWAVEESEDLSLLGEQGRIENTDPATLTGANFLLTHSSQGWNKQYTHKLIRPCISWTDTDCTTPAMDIKETFPDQVDLPPEPEQRPNSYRIAGSVTLSGLPLCEKTVEDLTSDDNLERAEQQCMDNGGCVAYAVALVGNGEEDLAECKAGKKPFGREITGSEERPGDTVVPASVIKKKCGDFVTKPPSAAQGDKRNMICLVMLGTEKRLEGLDFGTLESVFVVKDHSFKFGKFTRLRTNANESCSCCGTSKFKQCVFEFLRQRALGSSLTHDNKRMNRVWSGHGLDWMPRIHNEGDKINLFKDDNDKEDTIQSVASWICGQHASCVAFFEENNEFAYVRLKADGSGDLSMADLCFLSRGTSAGVYGAGAFPKLAPCPKSTSYEVFDTFPGKTSKAWNECKYHTTCALIGISREGVDFLIAVHAANQKWRSVGPSRGNDWSTSRTYVGYMNRRRRDGKKAGPRRRSYIFMRQFTESKKWVKHDWVRTEGGQMKDEVSAWSQGQKNGDSNNCDKFDNKKDGECRPWTHGAWKTFKQDGKAWAFAACKFEHDDLIEDFPVGKGTGVGQFRNRKGLLVFGRGIVLGGLWPAESKDDDSKVEILTEGDSGFRTVALCGQGNPDAVDSTASADGKNYKEQDDVSGGINFDAIQFR